MYKAVEMNNEYKIKANSLLKSIQSCIEQLELSGLLNEVSLFCKGPQSIDWFFSI